MRKAGIDCWIVMSREFNEDPVMPYLMDVTAEGGHRNAFMFFDDGSGQLQRVIIGTHLPSKSKIWTKTESYQTEPGINGPSLKPALRKQIEAWKPRKIGVNQSRTNPFCDGLTVEMKKFLVEAIGPEYEKKLVSAEDLIVDFLDTRLSEELQYFKEACEITMMINEEVLSNKTIIPGKTTLGEVRWSFYDRLAALDLETWFEPGVDVKRPTGEESSEETVIRPGDLVHTDFGLVYLGLSTDFQKTAYVLKPGETEAPKGYQKALEKALKVQDAVIQTAQVGLIAYRVWAEAETLFKSWGIQGSIYSHSIGVGGHGIGAWLNAHWPDRYSERTAYPLRLHSVIAIESSGTSEIPEWGNKKFSMGTEEDAVLTEKGYRYVIPRQEKLYLIR